MGLIAALKRYRVSRGYGVHSPFAYHFITCVLREKLPYYAFREDITDPEERCLFRVANYFRPGRVALVGSGTDRAREVILKACPRVEFAEDDDADFTYSVNTVPPRFRALYIAKAPDTEAADAMTFSNGKSLIAVRRKGLPSQHFRLDF